MIHIVRNTILAILLVVNAFSCFGQKNISDKAWNENWTYWSDKQQERKTVDLPHDAMQEQQRDSTLATGQASGFFGGDIYHYEKTLYANQELLKSHVTLQFEGIYRNPQVYINGQLVGGVRYGYIPFEVCADGFLKKGENIVRIDADNSAWPNSRWYSGGGIYRPIHISIQDAKTFINNVKIETLSISPAQIHITVNHLGGNVKTTILLNGQKVAKAEGEDCTINIPDAKLWDSENPVLYEARVELRNGKKVVETRNEKFGIRQISWNGTDGFMVNGKSVLLKGGCLHHDEGLLGACEYDDAAIRKVQRIKEYGFNAIRSAHNPISSAMLHACDSLGMYVMDELWDMWYSYKNTEDYSKDFMQNWQSDVSSLVSRDYNHPSVIMYSIGNEVVEPATSEGQEVEKQIVEKLHQLDNSRPVTCGMNLVIQMMNVAMGMNLTQSSSSATTQVQSKKMTSEEFNAMATLQGEKLMRGVTRPEVDQICSPGLDLLDIAGYNYGSRRAELDAQLHPNRVQVGTETYPQDIATNWALVEKLPQLVGDFMWTAWDYLGEAGIGAWTYSDGEASFTKNYPWLLAGAGALDLLGNPTGEALWAKAVWSKDDKPYIAVCPIVDKPLIKAMWRGTNSIPNWSWPEQEGKTATVEVFTSAPSVKLYLNDHLIGEQTAENCRATFTLEYQPGTLKAVTTGKDGEQHVSELVSATGSSHIGINAEKTDYHVGDLIYLNIDLKGDNNEVIANQDKKLNIEVEGAELLGFGSAQPCTTERYQSCSFTTYYGQAQAILKAKQPGYVKVSVKGEDLEANDIIISIK